MKKVPSSSWARDDHVRLFSWFLNVFNRFRPCQRMCKHAFAGWNTQHWILNGRKECVSQMVWILNGIWNPFNLTRSWIQFSFQTPFQTQIIWWPDDFEPFENWTCLLFELQLILEELQFFPIQIWSSQNWKILRTLVPCYWVPKFNIFLVLRHWPPRGDIGLQPTLTYPTMAFPI